VVAGEVGDALVGRRDDDAHIVVAVGSVLSCLKSGADTAGAGRCC